MSIPESHASDFPKRRLAGWNSFAYNEIRVKTLTEHFDRKEGEIRMKKYWLAILLGASVLAAGCKSNTDTKSTAETTDAADSGETTDTTDAGALSDAGKSAYRSVLEDIYYNQQFPNGLELDYDGTDMSQNQFGVCDVDGDGREELVISYITASEAGHAFLVYDFVEALGAVREEFVEFPAVTFTTMVSSGQTGPTIPVPQRTANSGPLPCMCMTRTRIPTWKSVRSMREMKKASITRPWLVRTSLRSTKLYWRTGFLSVSRIPRNYPFPWRV